MHTTDSGVDTGWTFSVIPVEDFQSKSHHSSAHEEALGGLPWQSSG